MSNELKITKERVLDAAESCGTAKEVLVKLFPEAFEEDGWEDITDRLELQMRNWCPVICTKEFGRIILNLNLRDMTLSPIGISSDDIKFKNGRFFLRNRK